MTFRGDHVDELISASLTGDLTDAERAEMDAHIARCEKCRATLAAFTMERRILAALPPTDPPRDLSVRVRAEIESGRFGAPWWRRQGSAVPLLASAAVFSAAILAVVVLVKLNTGPVGLASGSPQATLSSAPTSSTAASTMPSSGPSAPPTFLATGQLGYMSLTGASLQPLKLSFINDATSASIDLGTVSGPPIAAALSPDGNWLAYITQKGETGANEVWAVHLGDKAVSHLGCSLAAPFTDRLVWSPDSQYLAYTLVGVDLGAAVGCQTAGTGADVWLLDTGSGEHSRFTTSGYAYAASFFPFRVPDAANRLWISYAGNSPRSELIAVPSLDAKLATAEGVFLPLLSPDGSRAIFWRGTMSNNGGSWHFSRGGMPQLSGDFRSTGPASPWVVATPLFTDLSPVGGEAFASGDFAWGPDSNLFAFWDGAWTGPPQSTDGTYPGQGDVDVGSVGILLSTASRVVLDLAEGDRIVDVAIGNSVMAITIGLASAGIGDPPSAYVQYASVDPHTVGGGTVGDGVKRGVEPSHWDGPAVYGH